MTIVANEVAFGLENLGTPPAEIWPRVERALESVDALHLWGRKTIELSGGELQRVCLASALALEPQLLLLDEPTSQLDPDAAALFLDAVERLGATVVLSEHRVARALELATRVVFVDDGRIVLDAAARRGARVAGGGAAARGASACVPATQAPSGELGALAARRLVRATARRCRCSTASTSTSAEARSSSLEGPNGSGKTTLARIAAGLLEPQLGTVEVRGRVGYLSQDPGRYLVKETALEEVALAVDRDEQRARAALDRVGLGWAAARHPRDLSSGERERLALAAVAVAEPDVLILDEPTRGVDPERKAELGAWLEQYAASGKAVARRDARPRAARAPSNRTLCFRNTSGSPGAHLVV